MGVRTYAGAMPLTVMPIGRQARAPARTSSHSTRPSRRHRRFPPSGLRSLRRANVVLMMRPQRDCFIEGITARDRKKAASRLIASTRLHSASSVALRFRVGQYACVIDQDRNAAQGATRCGRPAPEGPRLKSRSASKATASSISRVTRSRRRSPMSTSATRQPAAASARAAANPIGPAAPVTMAVFPSSSRPDDSDIEHAFFARQPARAASPRQ